MQKTENSRLGLKKRAGEREVVFVERMTNITLRRHLTYGLLSLFALNTVSGLVIVFLVGVGLMSLSEKLVLAVLADTIAQAAACFFTVTRYFFSYPGSV